MGRHSWSRHKFKYKAARTSPLTWLLATYLLAAALHLATKAAAFCPTKCLCDDQALSANCSRLAQITAIPTTLNPLLKRLTLSHLPLHELASSLSVYRQLEWLDLAGNQLRQVSYDNLNFRPAPLSSASLNSKGPENSHQQPEQLARRLKLAIERQAGSSSHLQHLDLSSNRLERLGEPELVVERPRGSLNQDDNREEEDGEPARDLERLAPFLTLTKLERLDLSSNRLRQLHRHAFLGLLSLRWLDLSRNQLEWVDRHALVGLIELKTLKLGQNRLLGHLPALGTAFCRAPLGELRQLELSEQGWPPTSTAALQVLPNQMFICTPKLRQLKLDNNHLRHLQPQSLENLQELEALWLGRNPLEQVPSDALRGNPALGSSLKHLDLSETLIEFVQAGALSSLASLQRLALNSMPRLISFDLAALVHVGGDVVVSGGGGLPPLQPHPFVMPSGQPARGHAHLVELELRHNRRLQALLVGVPQQGPLRFPRLARLDLAGAAELGALPLDRLLAGSAAVEVQLQHPLQLDLSQVGALNCSSCQLAWLHEALRLGGSSQPPSSPRLALVGSPESIGCAWPLRLPLLQLLALDPSQVPLPAQCSSGGSTSSPAPGGLASNAPKPATGAGQLFEGGQLLAATLGALLLLVVAAAGARLGLQLGRRRPKADWPPNPGSTSGSPSASSSSPVHGSSSSPPAGSGWFFAPFAALLGRRKWRPPQPSQQACGDLLVWQDLSLDGGGRLIGAGQLARADSARGWPAHHLAHHLAAASPGTRRPMLGELEGLQAAPRHIYVTLDRRGLSPISRAGSGLATAKPPPLEQPPPPPPLRGPDHNNSFEWRPADVVGGQFSLKPEAARGQQLASQLASEGDFQAAAGAKPWPRAPQADVTAHFAAAAEPRAARGGPTPPHSAAKSHHANHGPPATNSDDRRVINGLPGQQQQQEQQQQQQQQGADGRPLGVSLGSGRGNAIMIGQQELGGGGGGITHQPAAGHNQIERACDYLDEQQLELELDQAPPLQRFCDIPAGGRPRRKPRPGAGAISGPGQEPPAGQPPPPNSAGEIYSNQFYYCRASSNGGGGGGGHKLG